MIYDLKGNQRGRHIEPSGKAGEVLLDANLEKSSFFFRPDASSQTLTTLPRLNSTLESPSLPARLQQKDPPFGPPQRQCVPALLPCCASSPDLPGLHLLAAKFLSEQGVMDYSVVCAVDQHQSEITAGIIDYIRTFTWDKKVRDARAAALAAPPLTPPSFSSAARELG